MRKAHGTRPCRSPATTGVLAGRPALPREEVNVDRAENAEKKAFGVAHHLPASAPDDVDIDQLTNDLRSLRPKHM